MSDFDSKENMFLRTCYVILFYIIYGLSDVLILLIALVQTLLMIFSGGPSQTLKEFGASLGIYVKEIAQFVSYASDKKPFPFSDWPVSTFSDVPRDND